MNNARTNWPQFSVVLDAFARFGYRSFAQIVQTARGTNTASLFSMQSLPQLMQVGRAFKEDVTFAPNTTMTLRTHDEEIARYFLRASAEHVSPAAASRCSAGGCLVTRNTVKPINRSSY